LGVAAAALSATLPAQAARATVREYRRAFPTYPFSDPNPIAVVGRIYPYFRFDGFTNHSEQREWKVVELENDYLRVMILPEVGGKIWNAVDKRTNRSFIYYNQAVKFRDVAMRGPWTSGGIEANYGIIGHTPNVATPVDYVTRTNPDGSVSCIIGALDLLTRTPWRLEIRLGQQDAAFSTSSFWYNASPIEQPYYSWMNVGIKVKGNLQFVYPGTSHLGHAGEHEPWPIDPSGRDISWYENNNFGGYKSYHVFGQATDFFGAYWHDDDFGMVRYAPRDEKAGKKIWIWGLSRQGMIWEQLLTDTDGQYAEVQSGRLFNQSAEQSTFTPFKHRGFAPHTADRWTEYWYPVAGTKGIVAASRAGALNVTPLGDRIVVAFSPVQPFADTVRVFDGTRRVYTKYVARKSLDVFVDTIALGVIPRDSIRVTLGNDLLVYTANPKEGALARPLDTPVTFNWQSAYGQYLRGKEWLRQRAYEPARAHLDSALALDPLLPPALIDRAMLAIRAAEYDAARQFAMTALSVDTYDGGANYYYGLANRRLGKLADAKDGFELAAQTPEFRGAAWTELARLALSSGQLAAAAGYADKALSAEAGNLDALGVAIVAARRVGDRVGHERLLVRLETLDPLSHHARLERLLALGDAALGANLAQGIRGELPEQVLLDLAAWYVDAGDVDVARQVLEAAGDQPEALYWRAQLVGAVDGTIAGALVERANRLSPRLVFPFRPEMVVVLESATRRTTHWKPRYYLALVLWGLGRTSEAESLLRGLGDQPDYAPVYATRASFPGRAAADVRRDLERAGALDASEWRYGKLLAEHVLVSGDTTAAMEVAGTYYARFPTNYLLGLTLAKALVGGRRFREADTLLARLSVLPQEGASEAHAMYRQAKLMLAVDAIGIRRWKRAGELIAAARLWPERLGEGKPYDADVDERLEDWLLADVLERSGNHTQASALWTRLAAPEKRSGTASDVLARWSLERLGRSAEAKQLGDAWPDPRISRDAEGRVLTAWRALTPAPGRS
jgi:tetratricopeptide (TPR) repeat protein